LKAGDIPGFAPQGTAAATNPRSWVSAEGYPVSERGSEVRRLKGLGFMSASSEHLAPLSTNAEALSIVVRFHSPRSAAANVAHEAAKSEKQGAKRFAVAGIPGAMGFGGNFGSTTGYNVAFAVGPYYYLAGVGYPTGTTGAPTREQLIGAARRLYRRSPGR
jgi:hypothetical protein